MRKTLSVFIVVVSVLAGVSAAAPEERSENLGQILKDGIASGAKEIVIPPGRYRASPTNQEHLRLAGLRDTTIIADGVEMVCTQTTRAITIENCKNVTIRGMTIDYDPLPFTQAKIREIASDGSRMEVEILEGYPEPGGGTGAVEIFDPETSRLRGRITYYGTRCESSGPRKATLIKAKGNRDPAMEQVGDIAIIRSSSASGGEIPHTIFLGNSKNVTLENITLFASNCFGFFENDCEGSKYIGCRVDRREPEEDLAIRAWPRLRSLNADAYHSKNARRGPVYERCSSRFNGDDSIAINGDFHMVTQRAGATLRVLAKNKMTMRAGDEVQMFTFQGKRLENRKIVSIEPDGSITDAERTSLSELSNMHDNLRKNGMSDAFKVTLDEEAAAIPGTVICSANSIGNGFAIRDCQLGFNRSRGIIVKAGHGEISGNEIEGAGMTGILITPEFWWLEAGLADNLVISDNRIVNGGGMGIAVVAAGGNRATAPVGAFRNITIRNNTVNGGAAPGLLMTSVHGLTEEGNTVSHDPLKALFEWEVGVWGKGGIQPIMRVNTE